MDGLQLSLTCVLLKMAVDVSAACPPCHDGYYVVANCSVSHGMRVGVRCQACTNCSAAHQEILIQCSAFADAVCGNETTPTAAATPAAPSVSPPDTWITLTVISASVFLILLLSLFLILLFCRIQRGSKHSGLYLP